MTPMTSQCGVLYGVLIIDMAAMACGYYWRNKMMISQPLLM